MLNLTTHEASYSLSYFSAQFNNTYILFETLSTLEDYEDVSDFESDELVFINNIPHTVMHHIIYKDSNNVLQLHTPTSQVSDTETYHSSYVTPEIHQHVLNYFNL